MDANAMQGKENAVITRLAQRAVAKREVAAADEVQRLLDAGREVMRRCGTSSRPRVADIVNAAGLSNESFYRHFSSKEALVAGILEDGAMRLAGYLAHQMAKEKTPDAEVRCWARGIMAQAVDADIAATTLAVLWNVGNGAEGLASGHSAFNGALAVLLQEPLAALGSTQPELDASLAAHATVGRLSDFLLQGRPPSRGEIEHVARFCVRAVSEGQHA